MAEAQNKLFAPWTEAEVVALNRYQKSGWHPFTCGGNRTDEAHRDYQALVGGDYGELVATHAGWICPVCGYRQNWAWPEQIQIGSHGTGPLEVLKALNSEEGRFLW